MSANFTPGVILCILGEEGDVTSVTTTLHCPESAAAGVHLGRALPGCRGVMPAETAPGLAGTRRDFPGSEEPVSFTSRLSEVYVLPLGWRNSGRRPLSLRGDFQVFG